MSTRCITVVRETWGENTQTIATIYRHHDGYPEGQGQTILDFLDGLSLVNGIGGEMPERYANGTGRMAAQLISHMQDEGHSPGMMCNDAICGQEWTYVVIGNMTTLQISVEVYSGPITLFGCGGEECTTKEFSGTVAEYKQWLEKQVN